MSISNKKNLPDWEIFSIQFLPVEEKMERKSAIMSQIANANFHENAIVKVPMAVIPIAGRSQQRSQTRPAVIRNEIVRNRITKRINIIFSPFI